MSEAVIGDIAGFDKDKLKHVETTEKEVLPDAETIQKEKCESTLMNEIEKGANLKHVETEEKAILPTKEDIEAEKMSA